MTPTCSIIVLNYFGEKVLSNTINSLLNLDFPKEKFEIIIVDNNSHDKSPEIILDYSKKNKNIRYKFLNKNKGFAGGNNEGISLAKGEYVILLNNDCVVGKKWLKELLKTADKDTKIFSVCSKILLYPKYYYFKFNYLNSLYLTNIFLKKSLLVDLYKPQRINLAINIRDGFFSLEIPYAPEEHIISLEINFEINKGDAEKSFDKLFQALDKEGILGEIKKSIKKNQLKIFIEFDTRKFFNKNVFERVQNAGIIVFQDGAGRDIGAKIIEQRQYYEYDYGQFSTEHEVYAACGAAVLYRKRILDQIGGLDKLFFMYYEDVEISERARLNGYKTYYCPKAEVRHLHAFSSKEWSNFFVYQAEKGRLLHIFFCFPSENIYKRVFNNDN